MNTNKPVLINRNVYKSDKSKQIFAWSRQRTLS